MSKIRINDLARELEVKSKAILDVLPEVGVTEKKTHSSAGTTGASGSHEARRLGDSRARTAIHHAPDGSPACAHRASACPAYGSGSQRASVRPEYAGNSAYAVCGRADGRADGRSAARCCGHVTCASRCPDSCCASERSCGASGRSGSAGRRCAGCTAHDRATDRTASRL